MIAATDERKATMTGGSARKRAIATVTAGARQSPGTATGIPRTREIPRIVTATRGTMIEIVVAGMIVIAVTETAGNPKTATGITGIAIATGIRIAVTETA